MAVGGIGVGVLVGGTVGNSWVGVGSRVAVGVPTTRVAVAEGSVNSVVGVGAACPGAVVVAVGGRPKGVGVGSWIGGAAAKAPIPRQ